LKAVDIESLVAGAFSYVQNILLSVLVVGIALVACGCLAGWYGRRGKRVKSGEVKSGEVQAAQAGPKPGPKPRKRLPREKVKAA
jgi:hypothetical protein